MTCFGTRTAYGPVNSSGSRPRWLTYCLAAACLVGCEQARQPTPTSPIVATADAIQDSPQNPAQPDEISQDPAVDENTAQSTADSSRALRHAVFFSFKESSSKEEIQAVADAFAALPAKIDVITDFQWGTNNSPEGLDDGFTHCFLLSFADEAGRDAYIPHPAHSGEFADVLRPHMKDVFVFDYWGTTPDSEIDKELKHAVFFKFKDDAAPEDVKKVENAFAALPSKIDSIKAFEWGKNNSPEGKDDGFTHCFMVTFDSEEGRDIYLPHPDHKAFVEILKPVLDKVRVLDFWEQ